MKQRSLRELNGELSQVHSTKCVFFDCPSCERAHSICATWDGPSIYPSGATWSLQSAPDLDVLTLCPSIDCTAGGSCKFHGYVQNGMVLWS